MNLPPFLLDHWLAAHEFATPPIRYNLASSTGPAWTLQEVMSLGGGAPSALDSTRLSYAPPAGSALLREAIGRFYDVDPDWVVVTTGANEALVALFCLVAVPGGSIVLPSPAFPSMQALAQAWGLRAATYALEPAEAFAQSADRVLAAADSATKLVVVSTPHNPTGSVMAREETARLARALEARGIPLLVDEVYHPLYFDQAVASAVKLPNTIVISDCSKALSLPGLRVGWIIEPNAARRERLIDLRSYLTISGSPLTEAIAAHALANSQQIFDRLNHVARANLRLLDRFMSAHRDSLSWVAPKGGTIAFPWRTDGHDARPMCQALARAGVLVAPGDCFEAPAHFRVGFGFQQHGFSEALEIISDTLRHS